MFAGDVLVTISLSDGQLSSTLSQLLRLSPASVFVVNNITETPAVKDGTRLLCEKMSVSGDFLTKLALYPLDEKLKTFANQVDNKLLTAKFCEALSCKCVISEGHGELLVEGVNKICRVSIDEARLDVNPLEYVIDWSEAELQAA